MTSGSHLWQLAFISFAIVLILLEILRGWRRGLARQLARLGALIAAYFAAVYVGQFIGPFLRPLLNMPDIILTVLAGAVAAAIVYLVINGLGTILFKRTRQHESPVVRLIYGLSGAVLGLFFGAFLVWVVIFGVRSLGSVAEARVMQQPTPQPSAGQSQPVHAVDLRRKGELTDDSATFLSSLARMKNSLELGTVGEVVKKTDVVPTSTYETLEKIGRTVSDPDRAQRFLSFPGAREISENPKVLALRDDPAIVEMVTQWRIVELLQNPKILDALNDRELVEQVKKFDLKGALDYALEQH